MTLIKSFGKNTDLKNAFKALVSDITGSIPNEHLQELLFGTTDPVSGKSEMGYSDREKQLLLDLAEEEKDYVSSLPGFNRPIWISTAGGPGAGKSTAIFQNVAKLFDIDVEKNAWSEGSLKTASKAIFPNIPFALISPDKRSLQAIAACENADGAIDDEFYKKWWNALYFLSGVTTNASLAYGKNAIYDTTFTSEKAINSVTQARENGYYTATLMLGASDEVRQQSVQKRNEAYVQVFPHNVNKQNDVFAGNIPKIFSLSDEVILAWRDDVAVSGYHVACVQGNQRLTVIDENGFEAFCNTYPVAKELTQKMDRTQTIESQKTLHYTIQEGLRGNSSSCLFVASVPSQLTF